MSVPIAHAKIGDVVGGTGATKGTAPSVATTVAPSLAGSSSLAKAASADRWRPTPLFWIVGSLVAFLALIELIGGGVGVFLGTLGLIGAITATYALASKRRSWANLPPGSGVRAALLGASAFLFVIGVLANAAIHPVPTTAALVEKPAATQPSLAPSPTPTPTPVITLTDYSGAALASAQSSLQAQGVAVSMQTSDGQAAPADWTGWTIVRESPAAGVPVSLGSTVTLFLAPPAPVAQPAPAPAAPAPAPAAPVAPGGGATALCNDGSLSYAAHHQGACSHHGGVAQFYK